MPDENTTTATAASDSSIGFNGGDVQYLPGPWSIDEEGGQLLGADGAAPIAQFHLYRFDDFPCAQVDDDEESLRSKYDAQSDAHGRLIVAAPDLLEALKALLTLSENADETGYVDGEGWLPMEDIQAKARAAIAKATEPSR